MSSKGISAPEPWREQPPRPPIYRRNPDSPDHSAEHGEFDWGPGLVPPHANGAPLSEGGMYLPKCPEVELPPGRFRPREKRLPRNVVRGDSGYRVG